MFDTQGPLVALALHTVLLCANGAEVGAAEPSAAGAKPSQAKPSIRLGLAAQPATPGSTCAVDLVLQGHGPPGASVIQFEFRYDPRSVGFAAISTGAIVKAAGKSMQYHSQPGALRAIVYGGSSELAEGVLARLMLVLAPGVPPGSSVVGLTEASASTPDARALLVATEAFDLRTGAVASSAKPNSR